MSGEEGAYQMLWGCEYCETQGLLALDHKHCPVCGAAQDTARRYYPKEGEEVAVSDHKYAGADRVCPACDAPNSAASAYCALCGSDLEKAKAVQTRDAQRAAEGQSFQEDSSKHARQEAKDKKKMTEKARIDDISGAAKPVLLNKPLAITLDWSLCLLIKWHRDVMHS